MNLNQAALDALIQERSFDVGSTVYYAYLSDLPNQVYQDLSDEEKAKYFSNSTDTFRAIGVESTVDQKLRTSFTMAFAAWEAVANIRFAPADALHPAQIWLGSSKQAGSDGVHIEVAPLV